MERDKRQLPSTERQIKVYGRQLPPGEEKTISIKKIILYVSIGIALASTIIAISVVVTKVPNKKDPDEQGYLVNNGYYYPKDDPNNLRKCSLKNCKECSGTISDNKCTKCFDNSTAKYTETDSKNIIKCEPKGISQVPPPTTEPLTQNIPSTKEPSTPKTPSTTETLTSNIPSTKEPSTPKTPSTTETLTSNIPSTKEPSTPKPPSTIETLTPHPPSTTEPQTLPPLPTTILVNLCTEGPNENCFKCDEFQEECLLCNPGYFLPSDITPKLTCQKCHMKNCEVCSGSSIYSICSKCERYTITEKEEQITKCSQQSGEGPLCKSVNKDRSECTNCNIGYILEEGKCVLNYHFQAVFKTRTKNESVKLIDKYYYNIAEMIVDGEKLEKPVKEYIFENKGEYTVYYKIKKEDNTSLVGMFEGLTKMISISFSEKFNFDGIKNMNRMFYDCESLTNIDLSNINTQNVEMMNYMFYQCLELDSVDLSKVEGANVNDISNMFENCASVNNIDISNFTKNNIGINNMFKGIPESGTITISENLKNKVNSLLPNWEIIIK